MKNNPVILVVYDGLGFGSNPKINGWAQANTPTFDKLLKEYPNSRLEASGSYVGLPDGQIGNSEVGHLTIGAGEIVYTGLPLINKSIENKSFFKNKVLIETIKTAQKRKSTLHIMGLFSPGGVHSHQEHLFAILKLVSEYSLSNVVIHIFGDGRDVAPKSIKSSIKKLLPLLDKYNFELGTIAGRYYAMDRDRNFDRTEKAYQTICMEPNTPTFNNVLDYVEKQYKQNITDEFFIPAAFSSYRGLKDDDVVFFYNFRPDRARQLSHFLIGSKLYDYIPQHPLKGIYLSSMMEYIGISSHVAIKAMEVTTPIGVVVANHHLSQLRVAETEKYAHVTFFMDGGKNLELPNCKKIIVPSKKTTSFALIPKMSAKEITDTLVNEFFKYDLTICNFANADMVGHTGDFGASIQAMEELDKQLNRLWEVVKSHNGTMFLTADHGNIEVMVDENNQPATKHTVNPVPFICSNQKVVLKNGSLSDVAPTILAYLQLPVVKEMTGKTLLEWDGK